ncbi:hypothetical protein WJX84_004784 [Apatococcus fuscideae]|uniref:Cytochrome c oxidase copper chaperone n=1 Tax=Apatococcus fuscideae TaxID=2026836 RepID=A0AAW1T4Z6_9CHLO
MGWFGGDKAAEPPEISRLEMVQKTSGQPDQVVTVDVVKKKPTKKICCACPDTKALRDTCITEHGPDSSRCSQLIESHKQCLREEGFKV